MFKRTFSMILVLALALSMLPVTAGAAEAGQGKDMMDIPRTYVMQFDEVEPNNTRATANAFTPGSQLVYGMVGDYYSIDDDYDWFKFIVSRSSRMTLEAFAADAGDMKFCLYDTSGALLQTSHFVSTDSEAEIDEHTMTYDLAPGTYYIRVHESAPLWRCDYLFNIVLDPMVEPPVISVGNVNTTGKNKISWSSVSYAGSYKVLRSTSRNGSYISLTTTTGTSYTDTSATAGTTYYYKVQAISNSSSYLNSRYSNIVSRTCDLPRPTGIKATRSASTGKVTVSWNKVSGADKYSVYYSTDGSTFNLLKTISGTSLTHSSAPLGKTVYYKIVAVDADKSAANSAKSTWVKGTAVCARPEITVSNVASTGKVKISWGKVTGASKYTLYIYDASGTLLKSTNTTGTSITHSSAVAGKTYTYKVKAIGSVSGTNSAVSAAKDRTCDLAAPTLSVSKNSAGKPVISWNKVSGAGKYSVYYSTDGGSTYSLLKTVTSTSLTHSSAAAGKTYRYKVKAVYTSNTAANSAYSNVVSCKVAGSSLAAPTASISTSGGKPVISWTKVTGATQYKVYYSTDGGSSWTLLKTMTGTTLTHASAVKGTTYSYRVKAVSDSATSANSNVVSVTSR